MFSKISKKTLTSLTILLATFMFSACKKETSNTESVNPTVVTKSTTVAEFLQSNEMKASTFTVDATQGGKFTGPKGTVFTIPPAAFKLENGNPVTGNITFDIKEIYSISDMILNSKPTNFIEDTNDIKNFSPLISAGEIFIKAKSSLGPLVLNTGNFIKIEMKNTKAINKDMEAFIQNPDTANFNWVKADTVGKIQNAVLTTDTNSLNYIYKLYDFRSTDTSGGIWTNSDDANFFKNYSQVKFSVSVKDKSFEGLQTCLVFNNINSMVHVYETGYKTNVFTYDYAPANFSCKVVVFGLKDSKLYYSIMPAITTANDVIEVTLKETTEDNFKAELDKLNVK